jgi:dihydroflavonol-4-reductase
MGTYRDQKKAETRIDIGLRPDRAAKVRSSAHRPFTEQSPYDPAPASAYVRSKQAGERAAWGLRERRGLPLVVIYPANALGAGDPKATGQYVADLVRGRLPATLFPDTVLTFVHVGDVAEAIVRALEKPGNVGERYLLANARMSLGEINRMIAQVAGVRLPRLTLPGALALALAAVLTRLADWTGRPPPWGMARDQVQTLRHSLEADGSKAERELGLAYTPIRRAVEQAVASLR